MHNKFMKNHTILSLFLLLITGCGGAGGHYPSLRQARDSCHQWRYQSEVGRRRECSKEIETRQYLGFDMPEDGPLFLSEDIKAHFRW